MHPAVSDGHTKTSFQEIGIGATKQTSLEERSRVKPYTIMLIRRRQEGTIVVDPTSILKSSTFSDPTQ